MPRVLLIEDDVSMLALLNTFLRVEGFEVVHLGSDDIRSDPELVLRIVKREKPALVLMDVNLKQMNGIEVLHRLRGDPEFDGVRVLMSSGMDMANECEQEGADGFLLKPYMPDELLKRIRNAIGS